MSSQSVDVPSMDADRHETSTSVSVEVPAIDHAPEARSRAATTAAPTVVARRCLIQLTLRSGAVTDTEPYLTVENGIRDELRSPRTSPVGRFRYQILSPGSPPGVAARPTNPTTNRSGSAPGRSCGRVTRSVDRPGLRRHRLCRMSVAYPLFAIPTPLLPIDPLHRPGRADADHPVLPRTCRQPLPAERSRNTGAGRTNG